MLLIFKHWRTLMSTKKEKKRERKEIQRRLLAIKQPKLNDSLSDISSSIIPHVFYCPFVEKYLLFPYSEIDPKTPYFK